MSSDVGDRLGCICMQACSSPYMYIIPTFLFFWPFLRKNLTIRPLLERIQKMDPKLGAVPRGAEVTRLGAADLGA
jgi:hypothetical protein